jgi:hypothetical protein
MIQTRLFGVLRLIGLISRVLVAHAAEHGIDLLAESEIRPPSRRRRRPRLYSNR